MANNCNSVQQFRHQVRWSLLYPPSNTLFTRRSMLFVLLSFLARTWFTRCKLHISTVVVAEDRPFFIHSSFFLFVICFVRLLLFVFMLSLSLSLLFFIIMLLYLYYDEMMEIAGASTVAWGGVLVHQLAVHCTALSRQRRDQLNTLSLV